MDHPPVSQPRRDDAALGGIKPRSRRRRGSAAPTAARRCRGAGYDFDTGQESDGSLTTLGGQTLAGSGHAMCGRFTQKMTWKEIHTLYRIPDWTTPVNLRARYNG